MPKRIEWIDIAKAFGIFLVILGHTEIPSSLQTAIYDFHLPLFFIIAGLTFKKENFSQFPEFLKKKFRTLIVPYIGFSAILFAFWFFVRRSHGLSGVETLSVQDALWQILMGQTSAAYAAPTWFLTSLFCVEVLFFILLQIRNRKILAALCIGLCILGSIYNTMAYENSWPRWFWNMDTAWYYLGFVALGYSCAQFQIFHKISQSRKIIPITAGSTLLYLLLLLLQLTENSSCCDTIIGIPQAILGSTIIFGLSHLIQGNGALSFLGKNSLTIFCLHMVILSLLKGGLILGLHLDGATFHNSVISNLLLSMGTLLAMVPIALFVKRFLPFFAGKKP